MAKEISENEPAALPEVQPQAKPERRQKKAKATESDVAPEKVDANTALDNQEPTEAGAEKAAQQARNREPGFEPWYVKREKRRLQQMEGLSMPFIKTKLALKTRHAQEAFDRSNNFWSEAMITLSETMRNFKPEDQCITVDAEVDRVLDQCFKTVETEHKRLNVVAENNGIDIDDLEIEYTKPHEYELKVISPRELRFHKLLKDMDAACELLDLLWMMRLVTDRARSQTSYNLKRQILRSSGVIRNLVFRAQASSQRNGVHNAPDPRSGTALEPANGTVNESSQEAGAEVPEAELAVS